MSELQPTYAVEFQQRALHFSYEKAGQLIPHQPIPWNSECVIVEASLSLPSPRVRNPSDYQLVVSEQHVFAPEKLHPHPSRTSSHQYQILFRLPPLTHSKVAILRWKDKSLDTITLPFLSREEFLNQLELRLSTLSVRLSNEHLCCETFVANQCRGLLAGTVLTGATSLVPLVDLPLSVCFENHRDKSKETVPVRLASTQLRGRQALLSAVPKNYPRRLGEWSVTWNVEDRALGMQELSGISQRHFDQSLRVIDVRYVIQEANGNVVVSRLLPEKRAELRIGPCFLVCSRKVGMAGTCALQVRARMQSGQNHPIIFEKDLVISDGVTVAAPGTLNTEALDEVQGFELLLKGKTLAVLPMSPSPAARFNSEGGFAESPDVSWSAISDQELSERLSRLLEDG